MHWLICVLFFRCYFVDTFELISWFLLAEAECVMSYPLIVEVDYKFYI